MACQCFHSVTSWGCPRFPKVTSSSLAGSWLLFASLHCGCESSLVAFEGSRRSGRQFYVMSGTCVLLQVCFDGVQFTKDFGQGIIGRFFSAGNTESFENRSYGCWANNGGDCSSCVVDVVDPILTFFFCHCFFSFRSQLLYPDKSALMIKTFLCVPKLFLCDNSYWIENR